MNRLVLSVFVMTVVLMSLLVNQSECKKVIFIKTPDETPGAAQSEQNVQDEKYSEGTLFVFDESKTANECQIGYKRDHKGKCRMVVVLEYDYEDY